MHRAITRGMPIAILIINTVLCVLGIVPAFAVHGGKGIPGFAGDTLSTFTDSSKQGKPDKTRQADDKADQPVDLPAGQRGDDLQRDEAGQNAKRIKQHT